MKLNDQVDNLIGTHRGSLKKQDSTEAKEPYEEFHTAILTLLVAEQVTGNNITDKLQSLEDSFKLLKPYYYPEKGAFAYDLKMKSTANRGYGLPDKYEALLTQLHALALELLEKEGIMKNLRGQPMSHMAYYEKQIEEANTTGIIIGYTDAKVLGGVPVLDTEAIKTFQTRKTVLETTKDLSFIQAHSNELHAKNSLFKKVGMMGKTSTPKRTATQRQIEHALETVTELLDKHPKSDLNFN